RDHRLLSRGQCHVVGEVAVVEGEHLLDGFGFFAAEGAGRRGRRAGLARRRDRSRQIRLLLATAGGQHGERAREQGGEAASTYGGGHTFPWWDTHVQHMGRRECSPCRRGAARPTRGGASGPAICHRPITTCDRIGWTSARIADPQVLDDDLLV